MSHAPLVVLPGLTPGLRGSGALLAAERRDGHAAEVVDLAPLVADATASGQPGAGGLAAALAAHLDRAGLDRVAVAAESLSASAALRFAARHPDRVTALYLAAPYGYARPLSGKWTGAEAFADVIRDLYATDPAAVSAALAALGGPVPVADGVAAAYQAALTAESADAAAVLAGWVENGAFDATSDPVGDGAREVRAPVSLLWGRDDRWAGLDSAFYLTRRLRQVQLRVFPHCGHLLSVQAAAPASSYLRSLAPVWDVAAAGVTVGRPA